MRFLRDERIYPMLGVMLALLLAALDQTIVATALPEIVRELNGLQHLSWVITAYLITSTVTVPLVGKLSDIYGRRLFFLGGIVVFLVGSALSGAAWSMTSLIIFRALQGIGAGAVMVNAFAVVGDLFAPAERGRWQGFIGSTFGLASIVGPLLGGWLTDAVNWRWIFYINIPIGILALLVITLTLPHRTERDEKHPIDFLGAGLLAAVLVPLMLGLVWGGSQYPWSSPIILGLFAVSAVFLGCFIWAEYYAADPVLPLWLFSHRAFSITTSVMFLVMIAMFGSILFIPLFAQGVMGMSATAAGLVLTPMTLAVVVSSTVIGQIVSRTRKYKTLIVAGVACVVIGMFLLSRLSAMTPPVLLMGYMMVMGVGLGAAFPIFNLVIQSAFDRKYMGVVTSSLQVARSVGGAFGSALLGGFLNSSLAAHLGSLSNQPFLAYLPNAQSLTIDAVEHFLTPEGRAAADVVVKALPVGEMSAAETALQHFLETIRTAFAGALDQTYFIATFIVGFAFILVLFLPEIELRGRTPRPALEEVGVALEEELGER